MDTRRARGSRENDQPTAELGTDTVPVELVELEPLGRARAGLGPRAVLLVAVIGMLFGAVVATARTREPVPSTPVTVLATDAAPGATILPTAAPSRGPRKTSPPPPTAAPTPEATAAPWLFEPVAVTGFGETNPATVQDIWALPDRLVATAIHRVGEPESHFLTSRDGRLWTTTSSPEPGFVATAGTVVDGRLWVVGRVGREGTPWSIWSTSDGAGWERVVGLDGLERDIVAVRHLERGPGGWVAAVRLYRYTNEGPAPVGDELRTSPDGVHWQPAPIVELPMYATIAGLASNGDAWVVATNEYNSIGLNLLVTRSSRDCESWSEPTVVAQGDVFASALTTIGDRFALVGGEDAAVAASRSWFSSDGAGWTYSALFFGSPDGWTMGASFQTASGAIALAEGEGGGAWVSPDGAIWRYRSILPGDQASELLAGAALGDVIVVGGFTGTDTLFWVGSLAAIEAGE